MLLTDIDFLLVRLPMEYEPIQFATGCM